MIIKEEAHRKLIRNAEIRSEAVVFATPKSRQNSIHCTHCFKQGHEARNYYLLVGYSERSLEWWWERGQEIGVGDHRGRGRNNGGRRRDDGRDGFGQGVLRSFPASSGWAKGAAVEHGEATTTVAMGSSSSIGFPGLLPKQWSSFDEILNNHQRVSSSNNDSLPGKLNKKLDLRQ
ncbi:hypothetical protein M9H77_13564 [Catharanthus roseus]|uniref:Uncharacterized protein n=1 Tax=Catharanthus roseus TaxID=4058 RepID=A0ACC0BKQ2_CATRO|nr:hypothetical protein M9H77_13564 [Catharanthus roseus]